MAEYINRAELISNLKDLPEQERIEYMGIYDLVKSQPAADVAEVRHGKWLTWEEQFPDRKPTKKNNLGVFCNNCHSHADNMTDYCPYCGAKMDGDTNDEP